MATTGQRPRRALEPFTRTSFGLWRPTVAGVLRRELGSALTMRERDDAEVAELADLVGRADRASNHVEDPSMQTAAFGRVLEHLLEQRRLSHRKAGAGAPSV